MEAAVEDFVDEPAGDTGAADGCHLLTHHCCGVFVDVGRQPWWHGLPVFPDVEGEVVDCTVKTRKTCGIFIVIERGAGLRESLVSESVLELLDLRIFLKVVLLDLAVFVIYGAVLA